MTEHEWLACDDVREMLDWLQTRSWTRFVIWLDRGAGREQMRRLYLFATACFARVASGDVCPDAREQEIAPWNDSACASAAVTVEAWAERWADVASRCVAWQRAYSGGQLDWPEFRCAREVERRVQAALLRCIYGNPFGPTPGVNLDWLESGGRAAVRLARAIVTTNEFGRMHELADALDDAGCPDAGLAAHCRGAGEHARGCWAIELLVGADELPEAPPAGGLGEELLRSLQRIRPAQGQVTGITLTPRGPGRGSASSRPPERGSAHGIKTQ
jgi:hypothetical protein